MSEDKPFECFTINGKVVFASENRCSDCGCFKFWYGCDLFCPRCSTQGRHDDLLEMYRLLKLLVMTYGKTLKNQTLSKGEIYEKISYELFRENLHRWEKHIQAIIDKDLFAEQTQSNR